MKTDVAARADSAPAQWLNSKTMQEHEARAGKNTVFRSSWQVGALWQQNGTGRASWERGGDSKKEPQ